MAVAAPRPDVAAPPRGGPLLEWLTSVDHKEVGLIYVARRAVFARIAGRLRQHGRHDPDAALPLHGPPQGAVLHLDDPLDQRADPGRHPAADGRPDHAAAGPPPRGPLLRRRERRLGAAVAAPVLVLRTP